MKRYFILIFLLLAAGLTIAQSLVYQSGNKPEILQKLNVEQDPRLTQLLEMHIRNNEKMEGINGYRVEIFFSSSMNALENAQKARTDFLNSNPDIKVYIIFNSPDFKVRAGNFKTKSEALKLMKKIQGSFPKSFIVPDIIDFPALN
ncbi:MAG: SPOR domain-containing protein [Prolixibacteraceae bacterium]|nr:SPOR domain-containing protein [Prolixibacteraceae bacterium]